jgi:cytochrome c peroxidase
MDTGIGRAAVVILAAACGETATQPPGDGPADPRVRFDLRALGPTPYPSDNPPSAAKIELGRLLFFDPVLSGERDVSCGSCHHPDFGFADGRPRSVGPGGTGLGPDRQEGVSAVSGIAIAEMPRNAPTVLGAALNGRGSGVPAADGFQFWDGRAAGLEDQALRPITARAEMRGDAYPEEHALDSVVARLRAIPEYVGRFEAAFGSGAGGMDPGAVDSDRIAKAIATYERELVPRAAPFDRYVAGDDEALSELELAGLEVFFDRAACTQCHLGPGLSNSGFRVTGVPPEGPGGQVIAGDDAGREEHTGLSEDRYAFRVPGLRNVELTAPYMHDGVFETLEEVVRFYDSGGHPRHPQVDDAELAIEMPRPLQLTDREIDALVAFLRTLTDPGDLLPAALVSVPGQVPSGLTPVSGVSGE